MTEEKFGELTRKHDETLERLQVQEGREKRNRWTVLLSLLGALGAGGGGGIAYLQDMGDDESVKTAVATHVATYEQWRSATNEDIGQMVIEQKNLRDAVIRLQVTVEMLSDKHSGNARLRAGLAEVSELLGATGKQAPKSKPAPPDVARAMEDLFGEGN